MSTSFSYNSNRINLPHSHLDNSLHRYVTALESNETDDKKRPSHIRQESDRYGRSIPRRRTDADLTNTSLAHNTEKDLKVLSIDLSNRETPVKSKTEVSEVTKRRHERSDTYGGNILPDLSALQGLPILTLPSDNSKTKLKPLAIQTISEQTKEKLNKRRSISSREGNGAHFSPPRMITSLDERESRRAEKMSRMREKQKVSNLKEKQPLSKPKIESEDSDRRGIRKLQQSDESLQNSKKSLSDAKERKVKTRRLKPITLVDVSNNSEMNYITLVNGKKISPPVQIQTSTRPDLISPQNEKDVYASLPVVNISKKKFNGLKESKKLMYQAQVKLPDKAEDVRPKTAPSLEGLKRNPLISSGRKVYSKKAVSSVSLERKVSRRSMIHSNSKQRLKKPVKSKRLIPDSVVKSKIPSLPVELQKTSKATGSELGSKLPDHPQSPDLSSEWENIADLSDPPTKDETKVVKKRLPVESSRPRLKLESTPSSAVKIQNLFRGIVNPPELFDETVKPRAVKSSRREIYQTFVDQPKNNSTSQSPPKNSRRASNENVQSKQGESLSNTKLTSLPSAPRTSKRTVSEQEIRRVDHVVPGAPISPKARRATSQQDIRIIGRVERVDRQHRRVADSGEGRRVLREAGLEGRVLREADHESHVLRERDQSRRIERERSRRGDREAQSTSPDERENAISEERAISRQRSNTAPSVYSMEPPSYHSIDGDTPPYREKLHKHLDLLSFDPRFFMPVLRINKRLIKTHSKLEKSMWALKEFGILPIEVNLWDVRQVDDRNLYNIIPSLLNIEQQELEQAIVISMVENENSQENSENRATSPREVGSGNDHPYRVYR